VSSQREHMEMTDSNRLRTADCGLLIDALLNAD
jgi:hypothetical protein